jgi:acetylornithine deacetylase/succinyl-diaminopimelate desuccinylase-like protein
VIRPDELATLAAIPAPTGAEDDRRRWLEQRLASHPGERDRDAVGNLVWRFGPERPRLLVMAHLDTVFDAEIRLSIHREGDELVGPGVGDNAAAIMSIIWALEAMPAIPAGLAVAFTVGEEGLGNLRGALHACAELKPANALALEGHGLDQVITDHVGSVRAKVEVSGPGGHSWWDRGTPSATDALARLAFRLVESGANIGTIAGGTAVNAIAGHAEMLLERRSLEQAQLESFGAQLEELTVDPPLELKLTIAGQRAAGRTPREHPLVKTVEAARMKLGLPDQRGTGSTDANAAAALGIPALALGCGRGSGMHTLHERISLSSLELGCRQVGAVIRGVLG